MFDEGTGSPSHSPVITVIECDRREDLRVRGDQQEFSKILEGVVDLSTV